MSYKRDYKKMSVMLTPVDLRQPVFLAFNEVLCSQFQSIHTQLLKLKKDASYKLEHTSQVCYIQAACNDAIDPLQRRIVIKDTDETEALVPLSFQIVYEKPLFLPFLTSSIEFFNKGDYDFQVIVPFSIANDQLILLKGILEFYKLAGKRYIITPTEI